MYKSLLAFQIIFVSIAFVGSTCPRYHRGTYGDIRLNPTDASECLERIISVPDTTLVMINCSKFIISDPSNTPDIYVYDGTTKDDYSLWISSVKGFCVFTKSINSSRNTIYFVFSAVKLYDKNAIMQITFSTRPALPCLAECPTSIFRRPNGYVNSPFRMNKFNYCNNFNCTYLINARPGFRVRITVLNLFTQLDHDILTVYDGNIRSNSSATLLMSLSGIVNDRFILSSGETVSINFVSDQSITHRGFEVRYESFQEKCGCPTSVYTDTYGDLQSPGYPRPWTQCRVSNISKTCHYHIRGADSQIIFLNFTSINLNIDSYLLIYDGPVSDSTLAAKLSSSSYAVFNVCSSYTTFNLTGANLTSSSYYVYLTLVLALNEQLIIIEGSTGFEASYWLLHNPDAVGKMSSWYIIAPAIIFALLLAIIGGFVCRSKIRKRTRGQLRDLLYRVHASTVTERRGENNVYDDFSDEWQMRKIDLIVDETNLLGSGAFGRVFKGRLNGRAPVCNFLSSMHHNKFTNCVVAVKMLGENANKHSQEVFLDEINCMKSVGYCQYLVNILGFCAENDDYWLVLEYCQLGNLLKYVRNLKKTHQIEAVQQEFDSFAWQIASGMEYLSSKELVHRDLAARNILLDAEKHAKIGDFGLCRQLSHNVYVTHGGRLPVKWMSVESIRDHVFTTKSDVWSYAVLLYELHSFGQEPFEFVEPKDMLQLLLRGERLEKPNGCTQHIYDLMTSCWNEDPELRPTFEEIRTTLAAVIESETSGQSAYLELENC